MSAPVSVWLIESVNYEQSYIVGVWSTREKAITGLMGSYPVPPNVVTWENPSVEFDENGKQEVSMVAHFGDAPGHSCAHTAVFRIWPEEVD